MVSIFLFSTLSTIETHFNRNISVQIPNLYPFTIVSGAIQPVRTGTRVPVQIHLGVRRSGSFLLKLILN
jgi:hypothetical protein